jgi:glycine hydroxymethyltransferase
MRNSLISPDLEVKEIVRMELVRQERSINLIPSENYPSKAILEAEGSVLTSKYAEGYPGQRYYQGCQFVDQIEELAIRRAKNLFKGEHANVQVHAGTQANIAAYWALLKPGDTILSLDLRHGGHLSHGKKGSFPASYYRVVNYGVDRTSETFDYTQIREIARRCRPRLIVVGASSYPRRIDFRPWKEIADEVDSYLLADMAHPIGLIAAGLHPDPTPHVDIVTATTQKTLRGPRGGFIICRQKYASSIDKAIFPGFQGGPFMHTMAAKAICFKEASQPEFKDYQRQVLSNAKTLAHILKNDGFRLISGGTDNHLLLIDLSNRNLTGKRAAIILEGAGLVANKNSIPFDESPPSVTSGIRLGTPACTTRGMKEAEMELIGKWITKILNNPQKEELRKRISSEVQELCRAFPIYEE